jgi:tetratricopeptide (TPR) repeat protein
MAKHKSDHLFQLIKSLTPSEKRYCTLQIRVHGEDQKSLKLFELLDLQEKPDEEALLRLAPEIIPQQLSNLKAHLYARLLHCMRSYHLRKNKDIRIREFIDHAQILFDRGLYTQCTRMLKKASKLAHQNDNLELRLEILKMEKQVVAQGIGNENPDKVNAIIEEVKDVNNRINNVNTLSNILVRLNNWYVKTGFVRKEEYLEEVKQFIIESLPAFDEDSLSFNEKLNLYNVYVAYYLFIQDFGYAYKYARKWVQLFDKAPEQIQVKTIMYIRGIHSLLIAQNKLMKYGEFVTTTRKLKEVYNTPGIVLNENIRAMLFKYITIHEINRYFLTGDFSGGISLVSKIERDLDQFVDKLGKHSTIIFYYKIACMYVGDGNHHMAVSWLQKIINEQHVDLREDVHCFARILNLISHFELGNMDVIDYYIKSTYRFLLAKDDLNHYQKYILKFLKNLNKETTESELVKRFEHLRAQLLTLIDNPYESRSFSYFDIISWLESKIQKRTVQEVIQEKARRKISEDQARAA